MSYTRAQQIADALNEAGVYATTRPGDIDGPTVLVTPPRRTYDVACGYTASWKLMLVTSGPGNEEAWQQLDDITDEVTSVLDIQTVTPFFYADKPAYELAFEEII